MQKVTELKSEPIVGKYYLVPCVNIKSYYENVWVPIVGEPHTDTELGVDEKHYHRDIRFFGDNDLEYVTSSREKFFKNKEQATLGHILFLKDLRSVEIIYKRKKCRRRMEDFSSYMSLGFLDLHAKYLGKEIKCGRCPHRNMPLESLPQDADGNVICSGHGLKISMKTKRVIERV